MGCLLNESFRIPLTKLRRRRSASNNDMEDIFNDPFFQMGPMFDDFPSFNDPSELMNDMLNGFDDMFPFNRRRKQNQNRGRKTSKQTRTRNRTEKKYSNKNSNQNQKYNPNSSQPKSIGPYKKPNLDQMIYLKNYNDVS